MEGPLAPRGAGIGKARIRKAARALGIPLWDAPASPCLSSRIRYGLPVTRDRLRQVELGEALLRGLGVSGDLRVRHLGDRARIEVLPDQFSGVDDRWSQIVAGFAELGFGSVERDPGGYRRGSSWFWSPTRSDASLHRGPAPASGAGGGRASAPGDARPGLAGPQVRTTVCTSRTNTKK
jgi:PP-loop superfamily ATP-utilizing enzyme